MKNILAPRPQRPCRRVGPFRGRFSVLGILLLSTFAPTTSRLDALVINEIMFHPSEVDNRSFEWIEIYNERIDPFDLSGHTFCDGIEYTFPPGTWVDGYSYVVVASDPAAFAQKYDTTDMTVLGPWIGALDNGGEDLELCNPAGVRFLRVDYDDGGKWPMAADGTGHSMSLITPYSEIDDPDSWTQSLQREGTPGEWNGHTAVEGSGPAPGADQDGLDPAGFILNWLVLGPYNTGLGCTVGVATLEADYLRGSTSPVESDLSWRDGQVVPTNFSVAASTGLHPSAGTASPTVELYQSFGDTINFNDSVWGGDPNNVMGYAFTYVDNVTGADLPVTFGLASDDAVSVLVNGSEVWTNDACRGVGGAGEVQDRANATLEPGKNLITVKVFENGGGWSFRLRIEERNNTTPITSPCDIQITTDVDAGMTFAGGGDPILDPTDCEPDDPGDPDDPGSGAHFSPVIINEGHFRTAGDRWIELYNRTSSAVDLSGYHITDVPADLTKATLADGTVIPAGGYLTFTDIELGLNFQITIDNERIFVALVEPGGDVVADAANLKPDYDELSLARIPDGNVEFDDAADPTRGAPNSITVEQDVVINEIMYHILDGNRDKEFIELYNRSDRTIDLSGWKFTSGIEFDLPPGTSIGPNGYLVIARNPAVVQSVYGLPSSMVLGPAQTPEAIDAFGGLRNSGERITLKDPLRRTVDTVRVRDGGDWPRWADGHGSSLELIDPFQDNTYGQSWDASDDSGKAPVTEFDYIGRHGGGESELHVLLLSRGISVVDDVSIIGGGVQTTDTPLIERGETWRYFKGTQNPPADWRELGFNDSSWLSGPTSIGYGDGDDATVLDDMGGNYVTVFCRKVFSVADPDSIDELWLSTIIDDGYIAYLNGVEISRHNVTGSNFDSNAISPVADGDLEERDVTEFRDLLVAGDNILAVQVHNAGLGSSDLTFNPALFDRTRTVSGGSELVSNGDFESNTSGWIIEGTHWRSGRTTDDPLAGSGSLKIIASGRGDNKVNRLETPDVNGNGLATLNTGEDLQISLKARWVVGSQTLLTHGYRHAMARTHELAVPENLGTPGAVNSVTLRQLDRNGGNLGPVLKDLVQTPSVPGAGESVRIRVRVFDADGVQPNSVRIRYSLTNPTSSPSSVTMSHIGGEWYEGTIPGQADGATVVFFIEAEDTTGAEGRYPVDVTERTHPLILDPDSPSIDDHRHIVYRHVESNPSTPYHSYRFWATGRDDSFLGSRRRLSNDLIPGSFVFGNDRIYHEAHTRFSGSPFARGGFGGSFRVAMPRNDLLHGTIRKFNTENHQRGSISALERITHYLIRQQNVGIETVPYSDLTILVRWQFNNRGGGNREHVWVPDVQFVGFWYRNDDDGAFFEIDDRFVISDTGGRDGNTNARVLYPPPSARSDGDGENKENYRWFFGLRAENGADDYSELIDLARVMDPGATGNAAFDQVIHDVVNVEEFLRIWAVRLNTDDWDTWGANRGKNAYLYHPSIDDRWVLMAWDAELTYSSTSSFLIPSSPTSSYNPGGFSEVNRLFNRPAIKRLHYGILDEMLNGPDAWFNSDFLSPFATRLAAIGMTNTSVGQPGGYVDQRADIMRPRVQSVVFPQVQFTISTNGGSNFTTDQLAASLAGVAPVEIRRILVINNGGAPGEYATDFPALTSWSIPTLPLAPGTNSLELVGLDSSGEIVDSDTITITSTASAWPAPTITSIQPSAALPGDFVAIEGSDFHNGVRVFFDGVESPSVDFDEFGTTPGTIEAEVPGGLLGAVQVTVRNIDGKDSSAFPFTVSEPPATFVRGDANRDSWIDLGDAITILLHAFRGSALSCEEAADVNDDGAIDQTDAVFELSYLFLSGDPPPAPFPSPGPDEDGDALGCED